MIMSCSLHMRYSHVNLRYMRHTLTCCKRIMLIRGDSASSHTKTLKQHSALPALEDRKVPCLYYYKTSYLVCFKLFSLDPKDAEQ